MAKGDKIVLFFKRFKSNDRFYEILNGNQTADAGNFDWGVTTNQAIPVENHSFFESDLSLVDWLRQWVKQRKNELIFVVFLVK
jgi:hypothetical protein